MKKRLIALMIASTMTVASLTGCGDGRDSAELDNEREIAELLEYDANTNISMKEIERYGIGLNCSISDEKFYVTFVTYKYQKDFVGATMNDDVRIKYEVDKDTYYDFKNHYSLDEKTEDVERVKALVEKYDPVEVINLSSNNIEK